MIKRKNLLDQKEEKLLIKQLKVNLDVIFKKKLNYTMNSLKNENEIFDLKQHHEHHLMFQQH